MGDHSDISWTEATWNPTVGCDKVSAGCHSCYAIGTAYRLDTAFHQPAYAGLTRKLPDGSVNWTGKVRMLPERLPLPLSWRKPRRIFVDSMSDLFHEDVSDTFIAEVFAVMAHANWHAYQVLTKRPERMRALIGSPDFSALVCRRASWDSNVWEWPLRSAWLGVSVEDQRAADERIPLLLQTPAVVRFLSCEPLIGPVDLGDWTLPNFAADDPRYYRPGGRGIDWVIAGGESGANARPCAPEWVRSLRDQCLPVGVAFHFKQWGGRTHAAGGRLLDGRTWDEFPESQVEVEADALRR